MKYTMDISHGVSFLVRKRHLSFSVYTPLSPWARRHCSVNFKLRKPKLPLRCPLPISPLPTPALQPIKLQRQRGFNQRLGLPSQSTQTTVLSGSVDPNKNALFTSFWCVVLLVITSLRSDSAYAFPTGSRLPETPGILRVPAPGPVAAGSGGGVGPPTISFMPLSQLEYSSLRTLELPRCYASHTFADWMRGVSRASWVWQARCRPGPTGGVLHRRQHHVTRRRERV